MKVYALMMTFQQMDWLPYSIKQLRRALDLGALEKAVISEGGHSADFPPHSPDGSWEYLNDEVGSDDRFVLVDASQFRSGNYKNVQPVVLNKMMEVVPRDDDSWIMYLHDDEFWFDRFFRDMPSLCQDAQDNGFKHIMGFQLGFAYNMRLHWKKRTAYMLCRVLKDTVWTPITHICSEGRTYLQDRAGTIFDGDPNHATFHFLYVKTPERMEMRMALGRESGASIYDGWYKNVFMTADLSNLLKAYERNRAYHGGYGFYKDSFTLEYPSPLANTSLYSRSCSSSCIIKLPYFFYHVPNLSISHARI